MSISGNAAGQSRPAEAEIESVLRRYPGVARARVSRQAGRLVAQVLPWGSHSVTADAGVLTELAGVNMAEMRFLHDEIFVDDVYRTHPIAVVISTRLLRQPGARIIAAVRAAPGWQPGRRH